MQCSLGKAGCRHVFSKQKIPDLNLGGGVQINSIDLVGEYYMQRGKIKDKSKKVCRM